MATTTIIDTEATIVLDIEGRKVGEIKSITYIVDEKASMGTMYIKECSVSDPSGANIYAMYYSEDGLLDRMISFPKVDLGGPLYLDSPIIFATDNYHIMRVVGELQTVGE